MVDQKHFVMVEVRKLELAAIELVRKVVELMESISWYLGQRTFQLEVEAMQQHFKKPDWTNHQLVGQLEFKLASLVHQNLISPQSFMELVRLFALNSWNQKQILISVLRVLQRHHHQYRANQLPVLVLVFSLSSFSPVYLICLLIFLFLAS